MNNNPLSRIAPGLLALSGLTTAYELSRGNVRVTSSIATIASAIFFVLYRRKSPHAASFLFWTTVPIYPAYFVLASSRMIGQSPTSFTLVVAATIWVGALVLLWRLRRKYTMYISPATPSYIDMK